MDNPPAEARDVHEFSAADRRAAQALSTANVDTLVNLSDPEQHAAACSRAIGALAAYMEEKGYADGDQIAALQQLQLFYSRQAGTDALESPSEDGSEGVSEGENQSESREARIALACLRKLQDR